MTRYPKNGKGTTWTVKELDSIKPEWKGDSLNDSNGLTGEVRVNSDRVSIPFRFAFKWQGKVAWHYCGTYPAISMSEIRDERDKAHKLVRSGVDPRAFKKAEKIAAQAAVEATIKAEEEKRNESKTFNDLYLQWIKDGVSRGDDNEYIIRSFKNHALPALANIEIRNLTEHHLRERYRAIIASGKVATAVELSKDIGQMLRWGEQRKPWRALMIDGNPSQLVDINNLVPKGYVKNCDRLLSAKEIKKLNKIFKDTESNYEAAKRKYGTERPLKKEVQIALWLCLGTLCRIGELLLTEWKHIDFELREWHIPAENTKGEEGYRRKQIVHLSDFTFDLFKQLNALTGHTRWAFPARYKHDSPVDLKSVTNQVADRQIQFKNRTKKLDCRVENNSLVLGDEEWTPHDLRRTGATMMQELEIDREIINLCQNHKVGSDVDDVYLLYKFAPQKRNAWHKLGTRLQEILAAPEEPVPHPSAPL